MVKTVKCVVWDLDDTVWEGTLLEGDDLRLRPGVEETMRLLDRRGILNSVASRNDETVALARLAEFGLADLVVAPQIGWGAKSASVGAVASALNIGIDTLAFVDDQPFERDEVGHVHPEVLTIDAAEVSSIAGFERMVPRFVTDDSRRRREMYRAEADRHRAEEDFSGTSTEFLASLGMRLTVAPADEADLHRAEELTVRTNQLNATGRTFSYEELDALRSSSDHDLLVVSLEDRYGGYGTIGLCLVERASDAWHLRMLLMSCRVMARGVGAVVLQHVVRSARKAGVVLRADFVPTERNRAMFVTYKFGGFRQIGDRDGVLELEHDGSPAPTPSHLDLDTRWPAQA